MLGLQPVSHTSEAGTACVSHIGGRRCRGNGGGGLGPDFNHTRR